MFNRFPLNRLQATVRRGLFIFFAECERRSLALRLNSRLKAIPTRFFILYPVLCKICCAKSANGVAHFSGIIGCCPRRQEDAMYFEQFYLTCLSHASYMIGSEGEAAVVGPQRDRDIVLK